MYFLSRCLYTILDHRQYISDEKHSYSLYTCPLSQYNSEQYRINVKSIRANSLRLSSDQRRLII